MAFMHIDLWFGIGWGNSAERRYFFMVWDREDMLGVVHHQSQILGT